MERRVVITGLGPISPVGIGHLEFWDAVTHGKTNYREITRYPLKPEYKTRIAAELDVYIPEIVDGNLVTLPPGFKGLNVGKYVDAKTIRKIQRFGVPFGGLSLYYGIAAAKLAMEDSHLNLNEEDLERIGCMVAAATGDMILIREAKPVFEITQYGAMGGISGTIAYEFGLQGVGVPLAGACASGNLSLQYGYKEIKSGDQDIMLVGSVSAALASEAFFEACDQPTSGPMSIQNDLERPMKPFDIDRGGFVLGEGAGVLVLEELNHALNRGAHIYAEVAGYAHSTDTATHMSDVSIGGYLRAMTGAVKRAGLTEDDLQNKTICINTHGTSTPKNDLIETMAIRKVFGDSAQRFFVNSIKGTTGHAQEASSAHELIAAALALDTNTIAPTIGLENPDPECGNLNFVKHHKIEEELDFVIKNASGFCGPYCTIILKKYVD